MSDRLGLVGNRLTDHESRQMGDREGDLFEEFRVCLVGRQCRPIMDGCRDDRLELAGLQGGNSSRGNGRGRCREGRRSRRSKWR
jgi:hypothetical protein